MEINEKFNFSLLKVEEILEFINKLGYKVDRSIIESTESDIIVELYCSILDKLGIHKKEKLKIKFEGMDLFSYTGLHDRPIYIMKFFNSVKKFIIDVIGVENFSSADLFTPNAKRTRRILSGLIKFFKFKQTEKETHSTMKENLDNSISHYKENLSKHERVNMNYVKTKEIKDSEKPLVDESIGQYTILSNNKMDLEAKLEEMEQKCKDKKIEIEDNEEKIKNVDLLNETHIAKTNLLKGQIVHSPEKMQIILEEFKSNIDGLVSNIAEFELNLKNSEKNQNILERLIKLFNEYENLIMDLEKIMSRLSSVNKVIYEDNENKTKKEKVLAEIQSSIENIDKTLNNLKNYSNEFHSKQRKTVETKEESLVQVREKLIGHQKRLSDVNEIIRIQLMTNKAIEEQIFEIDKIKFDYYNHIENLMTNLYNVVCQYSSNFSKMLDTR